jgi:hypothetical protein
MRKEKSVLRMALANVADLFTRYNEDRDHRIFMIRFRYSDLKLAVESLWHNGITLEGVEVFHNDIEYRRKFLVLVKIYSKHPKPDIVIFLPNSRNTLPKKEEKSIDKVTVDRLDVVLRMCNIHLSKVIIDRVIDCVELIEQKGGGVTLEDAIDLQAEWEKKAYNDELEVKYETPFHS